MLKVGVGEEVRREEEEEEEEEKRGGRNAKIKMRGGRCAQIVVV